MMITQYREYTPELAELQSKMSQPNPYQTWEELWRDVDMDWRVLGRCYLWKAPNSFGAVAEVWRLDPTQVAERVSTEGTKFYEVREPSNGRVILFSKEVQTYAVVGTGDVNTLAPVEKKEEMWRDRSPLL